MKHVILTILIFLTCSAGKLTMANHIKEFFNIDHLIIQEDIMSIQTDIFFPENFDLNVLKYGLSVKLDTINDILYFSKYTSSTYDNQGQFEKKVQTTCAENKKAFIRLWNASIISDKRQALHYESL